MLLSEKIKALLEEKAFEKWEESLKIEKSGITVGKIPSIDIQFTYKGLPYLMSNIIFHPKKDLADIDSWFLGEIRTFHYTKHGLLANGTCVCGKSLEKKEKMNLHDLCPAMNQEELALLLVQAMITDKKFLRKVEKMKLIKKPYIATFHLDQLDEEEVELAKKEFSEALVFTGIEKETENTGKIIIRLQESEFLVPFTYQKNGEHTVNHILHGKRVSESTPEDFCPFCLGSLEKEVCELLNKDERFAVWIMETLISVDKEQRLKRIMEERERGTYNLPSLVVEKEESKKVGRNEPCPCGSGKKYKQCCGKK